MTIKKILVPTDFSACANYAVELAMPMAKKFDAELLFLHLYPDPVGSLHTMRETGNFTFTSPEVGHIKAELDTLVRQADNTGVKAKGILVYDKGGDSIETYADSYRVDLIIMGSHGAKGLVEWFGGSNAQHVTKNTDVPLLVVKHTPDRTEMMNILFASSFDENVFAPMLFITELARTWDATIHLLYVNLAIHSVEQEVGRAKMVDLMNQFPDVKFTINFSDTNDEEFAITQAAQRLKADLITLTPHDRDGVLKLFSHSIAENLVNHVPLPVLVLPEEE
jgi:nucleotide-binding universal stress UspA family protein